MTSAITTGRVSEQSENFPAAQANRKGSIRPLSENDLSQVSELYQHVFGNTRHGSLDILKRLFFEPPWHDESLPSLAYEGEKGRIIGCLGVMPRHMRFRGRDIRAAVAHHFIVERSRRGAMAGTELARRFIRGPQDLALAEGGDSSKRIWEFLGGSVSLLYSFCWTRPLRPAEYALRFLNERGFPPAASMILKPVCQAVDVSLHLIPQRSFRPEPPTAMTDELDVVTMLACVSAFARDRALQPVYDLSSLGWLLETLDRKRDSGTLHKVLVRTQSGRPLGWYLYYLRSHGIADVIQVGGREDSTEEVLRHLFYHAWQRGAISVTGPMDPRLCGILSENHCAFHRSRSYWKLVHSQDPQILNAIHAGDAFLSRMEGPGWIDA